MESFSLITELSSFCLTVPFVPFTKAAHYAAQEEVPPLLNSPLLLKNNDLTRPAQHMQWAGQAPTPGRGILAPLEMHLQN